MRRFRNIFRKQLLVAGAAKTLFPPYSPIVDVAELRSQQALVWPANPKVLGIDFKDAYHVTRTGRITAAEASG